jgi:hypothetical protein
LSIARWKHPLRNSCSLVPIFLSPFRWLSAFDPSSLPRYGKHFLNKILAQVRFGFNAQALLVVGSAVFLPHVLHNVHSLVSNHGSIRFIAVVTLRTDRYDLGHASFVIERVRAGTGTPAGKERNIRVRTNARKLLGEAFRTGGEADKSRPWAKIDVIDEWQVFLAAHSM